MILSDAGTLLWALELPIGSLAGCPRTFAAAALVLGLLSVGAALLHRRTRFPGGFWVWSLLFLLAGWFLRDRLYLVSDSRLWIETAEILGGQAPVYRAPLAARILGWAGVVSGAGIETRHLLALISVLSGGLTAAALWTLMRGTPGRPGPALAVALVLGQPLSFVFFGHIETYALLAAALAWFLVSLQGDLRRGRPRAVTAVLLVVVCATHLLGALMLLPLVAVAWSARGSGGGLVPRYAVLLAAVLGAAHLIPGLRAHMLATQGWSYREVALYAGDVVNGWVLLAVPAGLLALGSKRLAATDTFGRILALAALTYSLLPFLAVFELGVYRDLDLFTPAFVCLAFLVAHVGSLRGERPSVSDRSTVVLVGAGAIFLAALVAHGICPVGEKRFEDHLRHATMTPAGRSYGYEVLAYHARQGDRLSEAETYMRRAVEITPGNHRLWGPVGEIQLARGDTTGAIASLTLSLSTPRAPRTAPLLAEVLTRTGRAGEAVRILAARREASLADSRAAAALAVAYFRVGFPESTVAVARARLAVEPGDHVARFNAASGLAASGDLEAAAEELQQAIRLTPGNTAYHARLIQVLRRLPGGEARVQRHLEGLPPDLVESLRSARDSR